MAGPFCNTEFRLYALPFVCLYGPMPFTVGHPRYGGRKAGQPAKAPAFRERKERIGGSGPDWGGRSELDPAERCRPAVMVIRSMAISPLPATRCVDRLTTPRSLRRFA